MEYYSSFVLSTRRSQKAKKKPLGFLFAFDRDPLHWIQSRETENIRVISN